MIIDRDSGYKDFMANVQKMVNEPHVKVGILGTSGRESVEGGFTVVDIASVNEFGSESRKIPERSFIRSTIDTRRNRIWGYAYKMMGLYIEGKITIDQALGRIGELVKSNILQTINDFTSPANAPSTIAKKGSSHPLIDTGRMKGAINYEVTK